MADISSEIKAKQDAPGVHPDFSHLLSSPAGLQRAGDSPRESGGQVVDKKSLPAVELAEGHDSKFLGIDLDPVNWRMTPADKKIFDDFDSLAKRTGAEPLTHQQKLQIESLPKDEKEIYGMTIGELNKLADGKTNPAEYMANNLRNAARLAEQNGRPDGSWNLLQQTSGELYRNYVGLMFSEKSLGFSKDLARDLAGSSLSGPGTALEATYQHLIVGKAAQGFNSNVADTDPSNSITHHYRELLMASYARGTAAGDYMTRYLDDPGKNPGDVRNGYFATMVGSALEDGKIKPVEAANLTVWAYTKHGGAQPPWGADNKPGNYVDTDQYKLQNWLDAYRRRGQ